MAMLQKCNKVATLCKIQILSILNWAVPRLYTRIIATDLLEKNLQNLVFPKLFFLHRIWTSSVPIQLELLFKLAIHVKDMEQLWFHLFAHRQIERCRR